MVYLKWVILTTLWALSVREVPSPIRCVKSGCVRGVLARRHPIATYLGVPYAFTDKLHRFQAPLPVQPWEGVFDAINENIRCPQRFTPSLVLGQENCLTLNIYTPLDDPKDLPVMVFIHGGGFREGAGSRFMYGPNFLVTKNVVLVSINYRVEVLGFLNLGIKEAPGNAGLKDQVAALKWVHENIRVFGGDPDNVTVFGESAGAASVAYHLLSPKSRGLFKRAIMQSGSALAPWALQNDPLETASLLAKALGYETKDPYKLYEIFMSKTDEELLNARVPRSKGDTILSETIFVPSVEKEITDVEHFIMEHPLKLFTEGRFQKVPVLLGYNSHEGLMFVGKENSTSRSEFDFMKALPINLEFPSDEVKKEVAIKTKSLYLGSRPVSEDAIVDLAIFYGDPFVKYPVILTINLILNKTDKHVYSYKFQYDGWLNVPKMFFGFGREPGATHADDLFYLFDQYFHSFAPLERDMVEKLTTMWTNFAKYGDPTPELTSQLPVKWPAMEKTDPRVFVIDKEHSSIKLYDDKYTLFWHEIYSKYRRKK